MELAVLLHNVRSAHNVGSVFRTADAAGVSAIYLSGYTPCPRDSFGKVNNKIKTVALGAEESLVWEHVFLSKFLFSMRKKGWSIIGVEQDARAVEYRTYKPSEKTLFVFGNEVRGLSRALRERCDTLIEIPMRGKKESLNVSVTAGIILFHARGL